METELIMIFCHWTKYWIYIRKMANRLIVLREFKTDWEDFKSSMLRKQRFCRITLPVRNVWTCSGDLIYEWARLHPFFGSGNSTRGDNVAE